MFLSRLLTAAAVSALVAVPAFAQTQAQPSTTTPQRPAVTAPAAPTTATRPAATAPAVAPAAQAARVNLNTATAAQLDGLPQIGAARAQAIITERGKGRFLNWADFERRMTGSAVNQAAKDAIRDRVSF
ncbi:ComEA family DNA-binding protein [Phreatobacter aquaticus]|nr:type II secretion system protein GspK [Phreatobacter aquaticus]